jgi:hypothetical protein
MRYGSAGDWTDHETIIVAEMGNEDAEFLVGIHEAVEAYLCRDKAVTAEDVDKFDMNWTGEGEPGDSFDAPYYQQHQTATIVERILCDALGIRWADYESFINSIPIKVRS